MKSYRIFPPEEIVETTVELPSSKSIAARALVLDSICGEAVETGGCGDTERLRDLLVAGTPEGGATVDVGPSGAAMRFLTALYAATEGAHCVLTGTERMLERPVGELVEVLRKLGADISYKGREGFPPLEIRGRKLSGGTVDIDASQSSQFVSALMMITPLLDAPLSLRLLGNVQSMPYIQMTAAMMEHRGATVDFDRDKVDVYCPSKLSRADDSEPDWSAAAFWYEIAALTAGWVTLKGLRDKSLQGDRGIAPLFERLGVLTEFTDEGAELSATPDLYSTLDADLTDMPDAVPSLAVTCCLIGIPFRLTGVGALHTKECDRIEALVAEMAKIGCLLETENYGTTLVWNGRRVPVASMPVFSTHNDHRMAMALAPVAVYVPGIVVEDIDVVAKSYPRYWEQLEAAGFRFADPEAPVEPVEE
ncbi:MAG: 3-phosphoshikimate 1-carboxyvinyltransferase [Muribaculaceae bacterium]|nr:3-phosphoshikimate 1-carboxyvinyltransferase [Muribaculaceae bacterium]